MVRSRAEVKGLSVFLEIEDELPESVAADETRLRQVLANLLSNAVKFTDAGSVVLRAKKPDVPGVGDKRASLRFEVEDTGIGIAPETMEKIFKPFEQAGDLIRRGEGVGLGLAISHQLVGMMGGKLQVKSDPGKGSLFWFDVDMPVADLQIEERVSENRTITGYPGTRRKILVVDDNASNREVIRVFLGQVGFEVIEAENGRQAVDMAQQMRPDLILMDRWMPEMNGTDAVKWIRHIPELSSLPVIAVSASVSERDQEQTLAAGFDAFLPKPVNWPRLAALLKEFLGLEWEYVEAVTPEREVSAKILIPPPREELAVLLSLARMGDMSAIMERAEHIRSLGEEFIPFAERLRALAERFEEQHILSLIRQYMEVTS
jgi:CheY-like chemotaxis protein/anti-sigma regulatory factor (Ser/Thr protein kinase)